MKGKCQINSSISITSNCNTIIRSETIELLAPNISFSNITFETMISSSNNEFLSFNNCIMRSSKSTDSTLQISNCKKCEINHVKINNLKDHPGLIIDNNSNVTANELIISNVSKTLLKCTNRSFLKLTNSNFSNSKSNAIHVSDQSCIDIFKSTFSDIKSSCIYIECSKCQIDSNDFKNIGKNGIEIESTENFEIKDNKFEKIKNCAILISEKSRGVIDKNIIFNTENVGISCCNCFSIRITNNTISNDNETKKINRNGISVRKSTDISIDKSKIIDFKECGISICDSKNVLIQNSHIENCDIAGIECFDNAVLIAKKNEIINIKKYAFFVYTSSYLNGSSNICKNIEIAFVKLFKGGGEFVNNNIEICPNLCENETTMSYYFRNNKGFFGMTNDIKKYNSNSIELKRNYIEQNLCMKCHKNEINFIILPCNHKVFCRGCAISSKIFEEKCPLCRASVLFYKPIINYYFNLKTFASKDVLLRTYQLDDFKISNKIGSGSFGNVYEVRDKKTNIIYAAKISKKEITNDSNDHYVDFSREVNIIAQLNNPSIVKFIYYSPINFDKKKKPVIITEYISNGSLSQLMKLNILDDTQKLIIIYGIAFAMSYLHSHEIIHRDLKPANILINQFLFPKVSDFGFSILNHSIDLNESYKKGTTIYMAPEIWGENQYSKSSDVYAFGVTIFELITNEEFIYNCDLNHFKLLLYKGYRPKISKKVPLQYKNLIESCWAQNPEERPTFDDIIKLLKNDKKFITDDINEKEYFGYTNYINKYISKFYSSKLIIDIAKQQLSNDNVKLVQNSSRIFKIFPYKSFIKLDSKTQKLINESENNPEKMFLIGQYLIEGQYYFPQNTMIGIKYLKNSMNLGFIQSAIYFCEILIKGKIIPKNIKKANKILEKYIKNKDESIYNLFLGKIYKKEGNLNEAKNYFLKSIELNSQNAEALYEYGIILYKENNNPKNEDDESFKYFLKAIENGCEKAMMKFGLILQEEQNDQKGYEYIKMAFQRGNPKALYYYALNTNDMNEKIKYLKESACKGNIKAMYEYGLCMKSIDIEESKFFLKKASDKGNIESMHEYGKIINDTMNQKKASKYLRISSLMNKNYESQCNGEEIDLNRDEEIKNLQTEIKNGNETAMYKYAKILLKENKTEEAIEYIKKAINKNEPKSMVLYAHILQYGEGVEKNNEMSVYYYKKAIELNNTEAKLCYANMLHNDESIKCDKNDEIKYFKMAIKNGSIEAMIDYATILCNGDHYIKVNKTKSAKYYKMAADKGNIKAMYFYALMTRHGNGVEIDNEEAFEYFKKASKSDDVESIFNYAEMLYLGEGTLVNKKKSLKYFKMIVDKVDIQSILKIAFMLQRENDKEAIKYYKIAVDRGDTSSMYNLGQMLFNGENIEVNKEEGIKYIKMAADKGDIDSIHFLAHIFRYGDRVDVNKNEAIKYYKQGADIGDLTSAYNYACMLFYGEGIDVNKSTAFEYFKMVADSNENNYRIESMNICAYMLRNGDGVTESKSEAINYYKKMANAGSVTAITTYARMLYFGEGTEVNKTMALKYFQQAANEGDLDAINFCAYMFRYGDGVESSKEKAIKYYRMAGEKGNMDAYDAIVEMLSNK